MINRRSPRWAFMERFVIPYDDGTDYLTRWRIVATPLGALFLHRLDGPDPEPVLHDHPWPFLAVVLSGGYIQRKRDPLTMEINEHHRVRWVNWMHIYDAHAIVELLKNPTWTLLFVGPRVKTWGFWEQLNKRDPLRWKWTQFSQHHRVQIGDQILVKRKQGK